MGRRRRGGGGGGGERGFEVGERRRGSEFQADNPMHKEAGENAVADTVADAVADADATVEKGEKVTKREYAGST